MNLTLIVLTYNEEIHIERCIRSVSDLDLRVVVVDSMSNDKTRVLAESLGAEVFENPFVNQAQQFQWAMDHCKVDTEWVLRLDADETIDKEMVASLRDFIVNDGYDNNGAIFHRKHIFLGKWIKYGGRFPLPMLRLFRNGCAHIEQRWMDEHIVLDSGTSVVLKGGFEDNNLNDVGWFIEKHNKYATREMVDVMLKRLYPAEVSEISNRNGFGIKVKRVLKENLYNNLPYFIRPSLYFIYRYFFQLGFLDGSRGFAYHFMQGFWYRALVDLKCVEVERIWASCKDDDAKLTELERYSGYTLR